MSPRYRTADLDLLIRELREHPPLTREEELAVARRARTGDGTAREQLIKHNLGLVISIASRFISSGHSLEDLVQEGNCGLIEAVRRFDPEKGNRFSTYAVWWIRAYVSRYVNHGPSAVRRGTHEGPTSADVSLDETVSPDGDLTALDMLPDGSPGADEILLRSEMQRLVRSALGHMRGRLGELGWDIVRLRLSEDDPHTLAEIGHQWGLSRERVRQVEVSTRTLLSRYLSGLEDAA